jgi:hypothetical protein
MCGDFHSVNDVDMENPATSPRLTSLLGRPATAAKLRLDFEFFLRALRHDGVLFALVGVDIRVDRICEAGVIDLKGSEVRCCGLVSLSKVSR